MFLRLLLLLTVVPIAELVILLEVHRWIAEWTDPGTALVLTVGTILLTGLVGAKLAQSQGLGVFREIERATGRGEFPGRPLIDGALILFGGALLLTPGILTDVFGLSMLFPPSRALYRRALAHWLQKKVEQGEATLRLHSQRISQGDGSPFQDFQDQGQGQVIDVTPEDEKS